MPGTDLSRFQTTPMNDEAQYIRTNELELMVTPNDLRPR